ncbi:hypothetical protein KBZ21_49015, partial [Streptomyces sp. A73]|nr:hypothetical protein [Streptomyces sp. A73]
RWPGRHLYLPAHRFSCVLAVLAQWTVTASPTVQPLADDESTERITRCAIVFDAGRRYADG